MMRKTVALFFAVLLCLAAFGCTKPPGYADDVAAEVLASGMLNAIGATEEYMSASPSDYPFYFNDDRAITLINDSAMMFHPEVSNVNELGVFRTADTDDAQEVERMIRDYLAVQTADLRSFAKNYSPEDLAKIDAAGVERVGVYVVYYILSPEHAAAALDAVRTALSAAQ